MATVAMQRDLVTTFKKETILNVGILSKLQPMPPELSRQIFKDNALEKPTQNVFNHLSYYLVSIIDNSASKSFVWPLYDTKTERAYRNELSVFINDYSNKGLLSPVMSSYLVNPGCYKVTLLMFQMSQLAVQSLLLQKMDKERQKALYDDMTEKYKQLDKNNFIENIEKETVTMSSKFSNYLTKQDMIEKIATVLRKKITQMESKLTELNTHKYINELVDTFFKKYNTDQATKAEILKIKDVNKPAPFFDAWLQDCDEEINNIESKWHSKMNPFLELCKNTQVNTQTLIARSTGEAEKSMYTLEYSPKTDDLCTKDLQNFVNTEQKYILKNVIKEEKLNFPNLIRGYLIAICYILRNAEIGDDVNKFNVYLEGGRRNYKEIVEAMRVVLDRVMNAEARLQPSEFSMNNSISLQSIPDIPPIPDLTDLKATRELHSQVFNSYTPLNVSKHQFNLRRKASMFVRPQPRSLLIAPFYQGPKDDFIKGLISCRISSYDRPNTTHNFNTSIMSQTSYRNNETIADCNSGFTKQQIMRLLSTNKKSSSSKKFKYKTERPETLKIKKGGLFNESSISVGNENIGLVRCHSSPNLLENRPAQPKRSRIPRKLSIMQEDHILMEVSGISSLVKDDTFGTPENEQLKNSRNVIDTSSLPVISVSTPTENIVPNTDTNKVHFADLNLPNLQEKYNVEKEQPKTETPKNTTQLIRKTSSLEKIINRFKKVRASVLPTDNAEDRLSSDFRTIVEEKENMNTVNVDVFTANRVLLPDLLSPSCSVLKKSTDYLELPDDELCSKPRESLGTALGVDHTFLDQFDLID